MLGSVNLPGESLKLGMALGTADTCSNVTARSSRCPLPRATVWHLGLPFLSEGLVEWFSIITTITISFSKAQLKYHLLCEDFYNSAGQQ